MPKATGKAQHRKDVRAKLAARRRRAVVFDVWIGDGDRDALFEAHAAATHALADAARAKRDTAGAEAEVAAAAKAIDENLLSLRLRALPAAQYEALRVAHADAAMADLDFVPLCSALLAECCEDSDLTVDEWAEEIAAWSQGDQQALTRTLGELNTAPSVVPGKGWRTTRS